MYDSYVLNDVSTDTVIGPVSTTTLHPILLNTVNVNPSSYYDGNYNQDGSGTNVTYEFVDSVSIVQLLMNSVRNSSGFGGYKTRPDQVKVLYSKDNGVSYKQLGNDIPFDTDISGYVDRLYVHSYQLVDNNWIYFRRYKGY